jgi:hypothetical protein
MLLGRQAEQATIDRLVQRARTGQGGGLVLRGEPGIGKSALLAHAGQRAEEMRVLRSDGVEAESALEVLRRQVKRAEFRPADRALLALLSSMLPRGRWSSFW